MKNDVFVKVNCETLGELKSTIIDKGSLFNINNNKYMMCAGKYTKEGWSIVFKASSVEEAEEILASSKFKRKPIINEVATAVSNIQIQERVSIPSFV